MSKSKTKKTNLSVTKHFRVTPEDNKIITDIAKQNGLTDSILIRQCVITDLQPNTNITSMYQLEIATKVAINRICNTIDSSRDIPKKTKEILKKELIENE